MTAVAQRDGDYESIKTVESVTADSVRLEYSAERRESDLLSVGPAQLRTVHVQRRVRRADLRNAHGYLQQFYAHIPQSVPGTTAIGTSAQVLQALRAGHETPLGIFIAFSGPAGIDRSTHPNVYDNQMIAKIHPVESHPVAMNVLVNDRPVELPAIHAAGEFFGDKTEFYFLDDPRNPLTLRYRFGIGAIAGHDRDDFRVTKIAFHCAGGASAQAPEDAMERALASGRRAQVYDIYFSFDSAHIRSASEPALASIAAILRRHPRWKIDIGGHTDDVGGAAYNLSLSLARARAVRDALIRRYQVDAARLTASGHGASEPQDSNATLEGRARNRRVELALE
ncbi:MAG: OmpA family protein [Gammaproteobacteria bacterium]|nr:OmpA family protein [Gammaproteobacteria bacterium]MDE2349095.1 OmpA family protein [Gammaproteobacteria bacterium]